MEAEGQGRCPNPHSSHVTVANFLRFHKATFASSVILTHLRQFCDSWNYTDGSWERISIWKCFLICQTRRHTIFTSSACPCSAVEMGTLLVFSIEGHTASEFLTFSSFPFLASQSQLPCASYFPQNTEAGVRFWVTFPPPDGMLYPNVAGSLVMNVNTSLALEGDGRSLHSDPLVSQRQWLRLLLAVLGEPWWVSVNLHRHIYFQEIVFHFWFQWVVSLSRS